MNRVYCMCWNHLSVYLRFLVHTLSFSHFVLTLFLLFGVQTTIRLNNPFCLPLCFLFSVYLLALRQPYYALTFAICDASIIYLLAHSLTISDRHLFKYLNAIHLGQCVHFFALLPVFKFTILSIQHSLHTIHSLTVHTAIRFYFPNYFSMT